MVILCILFAMWHLSPNLPRSSQNQLLFECWYWNVCKESAHRDFGMTLQETVHTRLFLPSLAWCSRNLGGRRRQKRIHTDSSYLVKTLIRFVTGYLNRASSLTFVPCGWNSWNFPEFSFWWPWFVRCDEVVWRIFVLLVLHFFVSIDEVTVLLPQVYTVCLIHLKKQQLYLVIATFFTVF